MYSLISAAGNVYKISPLAHARVYYTTTRATSCERKSERERMREKKKIYKDRLPRYTYIYCTGYKRYKVGDR